MPYHIVVLLFTLLALSGCDSLPLRDSPNATSAPLPLPAEREPERVDATSMEVRPAALPSAAPEDVTESTVAAAEEAVPATEPEEASPPPPSDLWTRLRAGYALPREEDRRIDQEIRAFLRDPGYLPRVVKRASPFLHLILEQIEARGMPAELTLLPVVESAFQPFAYSHGRAAGIWQFIPGTGRRYGLKQNWWYDGRRDIVESTRAALDYLEDLHRMFDGDWLLALAAYNSGAGTVGKAMRHNRKRGRPTDFWHLKLPRETRAYVPRLLAVSAIFAEPEAHGLQLPPLENRPRLALVETGGQIDLALAAELAKLDVSEIYRLNPGFNRWATDPDGPHRLLLPVEKAETFRQALAALPPESRVRWVRYRIREGDSLSVIAARHGITVSLLREANSLRGNRIRAGDHLLIPRASRPGEAYALSAERRQAALLSRNGKGRRIEYTVRAGDSLWEIARAHGVGVRRLAKWNGMAPTDPLRVGRRLVIWVEESASLKGPLVASASAPIEGRVRKIRYTVRSGDSLARIAQRFRVSVTQLCRWNGLDPRDYLQPGQQLTLHVDVTRQSGSS